MSTLEIKEDGNIVENGLEGRDSCRLLQLVKEVPPRKGHFRAALNNHRKPCEGQKFLAEPEKFDLFWASVFLSLKWRHWGWFHRVVIKSKMDGICKALGTVPSMSCVLTHSFYPSCPQLWDFETRQWRKTTSLEVAPLSSKISDAPSLPWASDRDFTAPEVRNVTTIWHFKQILESIHTLYVHISTPRKDRIQNVPNWSSSLF